MAESLDEISGPSDAAIMGEESEVLDRVRHADFRIDKAIGRASAISFDATTLGRTSSFVPSAPPVFAQPLLPQMLACVSMLARLGVGVAVARDA